MRDLLNPDKQLSCLEVIGDWVNKTIMFTYNKATKKMAPILFVGSHKDDPLVSDPQVHGELSTILSDYFKNSMAYYFIRTNIHGMTDRGCTTLFFFPVDNTQGVVGDPVYPQLLQSIEGNHWYLIPY